MLNLSPGTLFRSVAAAWRLALGRGKPQDLFSSSRDAFWQSVWGVWILHVLATSFASSIFGTVLFLRLSLISLISSLAYIWLVHFLLSRIGKTEAFLDFIIPYQWLTALQAILFGSIALSVIAAPQLQLHLAVIPVVIWMIFRMWRLARDVIGISGGLAVGFILARIILDGFVNFATGVAAPVS
ncbi:MAG: hypothetical protein ACON49_05200 [Candidatus Puniceispirillaceae bacterium]